MGMVYADIELINGVDLMDARKHMIGEDEIKSMHVNMLVDRGAVMLAINENIQAQLQFPIIDTRKFQLANGHIDEYEIAGNIEIRFNNRKASCNAIVLPGDREPLLGAIPLEEMDVMIHPARQELIVHPDHPYFAVLKLK